MWAERNELVNDPLVHAMPVALSYNDSISRYLTDMSTIYTNDVEEALQNLKAKILNSDSNRISFYKSINTNLAVHEIYTKDMKVNEIERLSWTKLRLSAHSLAIERGRWNRRGR